VDGASKLAAYIRAMRALREAGAMPQVFGTPTVTDGIGMGTDGMKYTHLVSTASVGAVTDLRLFDEKQ
jgi:dihydroxyacid dehydratase/phosphogluconate dehydratase